VLSRLTPAAQQAFFEPRNTRNGCWKNITSRKPCIPRMSWLFRRIVSSSPINEYNQPQELSCTPCPNSLTAYRHLQQVTDVKELTRAIQKKTKNTPVLWKVTPVNLDDWLTAHRSITLVDFQLDAQNSYLFTYNTFIKILYVFRALLCSSSGGLRRNCIYAASGIVTLCSWLSCAPVRKEVLS